MKLRLRFGLVLLIGCDALAQLQQPARVPLHLESPLQDKNFYLFSLMERSPWGAVRAEDKLLVGTYCRRPDCRAHRGVELLQDGG
jgi:hypothetical protein